MTDRLEHLDGDDAVKRSLHIPIVAHHNRDAILQPFRRDAFPGKVKLLLRDRDAGHAAAGVFGRLDRETAPAATDLKDVMRGAYGGQLDQTMNLASLGIGQCLIRIFEKRG